MAEGATEAGRRWIHFLFGGVAFLLPYPSWGLSLALALFALFVNAAVLPRTTAAQTLYRTGEGLNGGLVTYPLTVAVLLLIYRSHVAPVALAWTTMAWGDPAAAWLGGRPGSRPLPWNRNKTTAGSLAFILASAAGLALWTSVFGTGGPDWLMVCALAAAGAGACIARHLQRAICTQLT